MKKNKGIFLVELLITITLIMLVLPTIYFSYLYTEKIILNNLYTITKNNEFLAIRFFLEHDFREFTQINSVIDLKGINLENDIITYACKNYYLKRTIQSATKQAQVSNLNSLLKIYDLSATKSNHLLRINLKTDIGDKQIAIFLPNEKN
jgi:hypothetical protein